MTAGNRVRAAFLLLSVVITAAAIALAAPNSVPTLKPLGEAAVNAAPAMKISLAGAPRQKPAPTEPEEPVAE
ncbi:MAG: energy transducer TonB, partial [Marinobacter sp.]